jgi:hypothetical protein
VFIFNFDRLDGKDILIILIFWVIAGSVATVAVLKGANPSMLFIFVIGLTFGYLIGRSVPQ